MRDALVITIAHIITVGKDDCICTVHVVRSLNLLTPTHAQLYFIKKTI